jgi:hypothetical protein
MMGWGEWIQDQVANVLLCLSNIAQSLERIAKALEHERQT